MKRSIAESGQILVRSDDVIVQIEPRLVGLEVAAEIYGLSADTLRRLQDDEALPLVRIGTRRLVPIAAADAWFAARIEAGAAA